MRINNDIFFRFYKNYIRANIKIVLGAMICMILGSLCSLFVVKFIKPIIDEVFQVSTSVYTLVTIAGYFFVIYICKGFCDYGENFLLDKLSLKTLQNLQMDVYKNIIYLDLEFFKNTTSGDIISRLTNDLKNVQFALNEVMINVGRNFFTILGLVTYIFIQNFFLSVVCFVIFPLAGYVALKINKKIKTLAKNAQFEASKWTSFLSETFSCIRLIKSSSSEEKEINDASEILKMMFKINYKAVQTQTLVHPIMEFLCGIAVFFCIVLGGIAIINGYMTTGGLIQFLTALLLTYKPAKTLVQLSAQMQIGNVSITRLFELIDMKPQITDKNTPSEKKELSGNIEFNALSFKYSDGDRNILDNVNLEIPAYKTTVVLGESGIGKSTIISLLLRLYDPNEGEIKIDGINIKDMRLKDLHDNISVVSQDIDLFNDTIKNNIKYGMENVDDSDLFEAASDANIDDFITSLPDGYATIVGEGGVNFSGGQKQRITIARAFLKNAPILIFDEPTSALDGVNATFINNSIKKFHKKKTIIIITHVKEKFDNVDKIIEFKNNEINSMTINSEK